MKLVTAILHNVGNWLKRVLSDAHPDTTGYEELKMLFALYNQDCFGVLGKDAPKELWNAWRLGIDKELPTARDCRVYLYGYDPEEIPSKPSKPSRPNYGGLEFNWNNSAFMLDGVWYDIPEKYSGMRLDSTSEHLLKTYAADVQSVLDKWLESNLGTDFLDH